MDTAPKTRKITLEISDFQFEILTEALAMYIEGEDQIGTAWYYPTEELIKQLEERWTYKKTP